MNWNMRTETWGLILSISQILEVVVTSAKWIVWNFRQRENGKLLCTCTFRSEYQNLVFVKFFFTFDHSITFRFRFWKFSLLCLIFILRPNIENFQNLKVMWNLNLKVRQKTKTKLSLYGMRMRRKRKSGKKRMRWEFYSNSKTKVSKNLFTTNYLI